MARILLIEDDDLLRNLLGLTLTHFGHTVTEASNGRDGLNKFPLAKHDLVITDIVMPETEGLEVLMELKKINALVKVIAISGGGRAGTTDYLGIAKHLGAAKVLTKPFTNEALMAAINELIPPDGPTLQAPQAGPDTVHSAH